MLTYPVSYGILQRVSFHLVRLLQNNGVIPFEKADELRNKYMQQPEYVISQCIKALRNVKGRRM